MGDDEDEPDGFSTLLFAEGTDLMDVIIYKIEKFILLSKTSE